MYAALGVSRLRKYRRLKKEDHPMDEKFRIPKGRPEQPRSICLSCKACPETAEAVDKALTQTYLNKSEFLERCIKYALDHIEFI